MEIIIKGIAFGSVLAMAIGPVFFSLVQTSLQRGFISGVFMAIGISISDLAYVIFCYIGISQFANNDQFKFNVALLGGLILIIFGLYSFFKKFGGKELVQKKNNKKGVFRAIVKGFLINGINPFVFIFWFGAMSLATVEYGFSGYEVRTFFLIVLVTVLSTDILKSYLANRLRDFVKPHVMKTINSIVGVLLIGFGARLIYYAYYSDLSF